MKYKVLDMEYGFVTNACTWGSTKRKVRRYIKGVGEDREVVIVTKHREREIK